MSSLSSRIDRYRPFLAGQTPDFSALESLIRQDLESLPESVPDLELEAMHLLAAMASLQSGAPDLARDYALVAHNLNPDRHETALLLSAAGATAGHFESASYFLKLLTTSMPSSDEWIATLIAPHLPDPVALFSEIEEAPYEKKGEALLYKGLARAAEEAFRTHLAFFPNSPASLIGAARALVLSGEMEAALDMLRAARVLLPDNTQISDLMASLLHQSGDFATAHALFTAGLYGSHDTVRHAIALNHSLNDPTLPASAISSQIHALSALLTATAKTLPPRARSLPAAGQPLTLAYVLDPLRPEQEQQALAEILRHHSRPEHRIVGIGIGPLSAQHNTQYKAAVDHWVDISGVADRTLARLVSAEQPDALIVTTDLRYPQTLPLLCSRLAFSQAMLSTLPEAPAIPHLDLFLSECAGNDLSVPLTVRVEPLPSARTAAGGCQIALAGSLRDFTPALLSALAPALHRMPQVTLLLRNEDYARDPARTILLTRFGTFGLAHRVDVLDVSSDAELYQNADLAILPPGELSPQSVITALAAGIPCVTLMPEAPHLQRPASLLHALGLGDTCVAPDPSSLASLIEGWATAPDRRSAFAETAAALLATSPLLDARSHALRIEQAIHAHLATLR